MKYQQDVDARTEQQMQDIGHDESLVPQSDERDEKLKSLQADRDALFDRLARLQAEFENFRKRAAKENADYRDYALADAARALLPVIDAFDLALEAPGSEAELRKGLELIRRQLDDVLKRIGVTPVAAVGEEFDPRSHEAIEMVESEDGEDDRVIDELQRGYRLKDRLLRPARVRVARHK